MEISRSELREAFYDYLTDCRRYDRQLAKALGWDINKAREEGFKYTTEENDELESLMDDYIGKGDFCSVPNPFTPNYDEFKEREHTYEAKTVDLADRILGRIEKQYGVEFNLVRWFAMMRSEYLEKKPFGTTEYDGETYILLQDAYGDWVPGKHPYYQAKALKQGEQPNEGNDLVVYRIKWDVDGEYVVWDDTNGWSLKEDAPEDESCLCDWDEATDVVAEGVMDADGWIY